MARSSSRGPRVEFDVKGDAEAVEVARALGARARDAKPLMQAFLAEMVIIEREQFESSGARGGKPWPENKPSTLARKKAAGQDERPERRTGALEKTLTAKRATGAIRRASKGSVTVGTRVPYARYAGRKRPLIGVVQADQEHWLEQVVEYLLHGSMPR